MEEREERDAIMDTDKTRAAVEAFRAGLKPKTSTQREEPETGKILATCKRPDGTELRVALREYQGKPWVDLRFWQPGELGTGTMIPTKKGVGLRTHELPDVVDALVEAMKDIQKTA